MALLSRFLFWRKPVVKSDGRQELMQVTTQAMIDFYATRANDMSSGHNPMLIGLAEVGTGALTPEELERFNRRLDGVCPHCGNVHPRGSNVKNRHKKVGPLATPSRASWFKIKHTPKQEL